MNTLDKLPDGEPVRLLHELEQISREIKAPQVFGSSSVISSRIFSQNAFDVQTPGAGTPVIEVEFIPDDLTFGGAFCYEFYTVNVTDPLFPGLVVSGIERLRVVDNRQRWLVKASISSKYKFYFFTAGSGTFTTNLV